MKARKMTDRLRTPKAKTRVTWPVKAITSAAARAETPVVAKVVMARKAETRVDRKEETRAAHKVVVVHRAATKVAARAETSVVDNFDLYVKNLPVYREVLLYAF